MYDKSKREEMLRNGFWPILNEEGEECLATARGNLVFRPELCERFGLTNDYEVRGKSPYDILVYRPKTDEPN